MTEQAVLYETGVQVSAQMLRQMFNPIAGPGVGAYGDMLTAAGAGLSVDVAAGEAYVRGSSVTDQGLYRCRNDVSKNSSAFELGGITAAHATLPRLDQVIARVYDNDADASGLTKWRFEVIAGTATSGATLDNRTGAAALPASSLLLYDIQVPAAATSLTGANLRDRRVPSYPAVPPLLTAVDMVPLSPLAGSSPRVDQAITQANSNNLQRAVAVLVPRRVAGATRIRWAYNQGSPAFTGNYVIALYDASGRKIVDTGSVAFTGLGGTRQNRSETITATTFEAGVYYAFMGFASLSGTGSFTTPTPIASVATPGVGLPNVDLGINSGGITAPTTILGLSDNTIAGQVGAAAIPALALSVG